MTEDELVERGMEIVNRLIDATGPCAENQYGERHCYHWRGQPPTLRTRVQADCCWCGATRTFDYVDVMEGNAPISVRPSSGAVHGTARDWLEQPTTHVAPISVSEELHTDPRFAHLHGDRAQKMADYQSEIEVAVLPLCERYGFGAVMQTAAALWKQRDPVGALKICECSEEKRGR